VGHKEKAPGCQKDSGSLEFHPGRRTEGRLETGLASNRRKLPGPQESFLEVSRPLGEADGANQSTMGEGTRGIKGFGSSRTPGKKSSRKISTTNGSEIEKKKNAPARGVE